MFWNKKQKKNISNFYIWYSFFSFSFSFFVLFLFEVKDEKLFIHSFWIVICMDLFLQLYLLVYSRSCYKIELSIPQRFCKRNNIVNQILNQFQGLILIKNRINNYLRITSHNNFGILFCFVVHCLSNFTTFPFCIL